MIRIALHMLMGDRAKYAGLILGIAFTSFLVTFAVSYFAGFMTQGFALVSENASADIWVMDPTVESVQQTTNMPWWALDRVRSIRGVASAFPLVLGSAEARFPNGRRQPFQVIGVDGATLVGVPPLRGDISALALHGPNAAVVDAGGSEGKLDTPVRLSDQWPTDGPHLDVPSRELTVGDELEVNDQRVLIVGRARALPRWPPGPLLYMSIGNAMRLLAPERRALTFLLVRTQPHVPTTEVADRISAQTGLRARVRDAFKADTVQWLLTNSEDVGDIGAMLSIALCVGFGVTGVLLYMFAQDNLRNYAVLSAMGATRRLLLSMIFAQAGLCALLGAGIGVGLCGIVGQVVAASDRPFRMMWYTPPLGIITVLLISLIAAALSARPVLKLQPTLVFAAR